MATLNFNRPDWSFPKINNDQNHVLETTKIAHPFISDQEVVANDYSLKDHRLALITGSNMAGKSTFLRTVGINAVLAYARSEEHTSELQSLMRISYAVFCLKKKKFTILNVTSS